MVRVRPQDLAFVISFGLHLHLAADRFCRVLCSFVLLSSARRRHIGVRVLSASAVLISNGDACAFLAAQEKPKTQSDPHSVWKNFFDLHFA